MTGPTTSRLKTRLSVRCEWRRSERRVAAPASAHHTPVCSWVSVLQNSREEALTRAFKGDQEDGENNIIQELTRAIVEEVKRMPGNDGCCDCGAAGWHRPCCYGNGCSSCLLTGRRVSCQPPPGCPPTWACSSASSAQGSIGSWGSTTPGSRAWTWTCWGRPSCW